MSQRNFQDTKKKLLKIISSQHFPNNRLPSEAKLAKQLKVSIVTLRQALSIMASEGYLTKRQGLGNFVHQSALDLSMRTDITYCVENLLLISGYKVGIKHISTQRLAASPEELKIFPLEETTFMLTLELLYLADGHPAALEIHRVPETLFVRELPDDLTIQVFDKFLLHYCDKELAHEITSWLPGLMNKDQTALLDCAIDTPFLSWDQWIYDTSDDAVSHTTTSFNPKWVQPKSLRKWNFGPRLDD